MEDEKVSNVVMEGKMKKKTFTKYQDRYFQLKSGYLYWFLDEKSRNIKNKINLQNIIKINCTGPLKIMIVVQDPKDEQSGGNIFKFKALDAKSHTDWVKAITDEMNKIKGENKNKNNSLFKTETKKKCVKDYLKLPDIGTERTNIKLQIISQIKSEGFFSFINEPEKKDENSGNISNYSTNNEDGAKKPENNDNYDPHIVLFNEGELKHYDVGLKEARESDDDVGTGFCCGAFFGLFSGRKKS